MDDYYEWADHAINSSPKYSTGFTLVFASGPYWINDNEWDLYKKRLQLIREFQTTCVDLFRKALDRGKDSFLVHWLLNETPVNLGYNYHKNLEDRHYELPRFFRTDEAGMGKIVEIQCPGSIWGELQLSFEFCEKSGYEVTGLSPVSHFVEQLKQLVTKDPIVYHMLDHSSAPGGMRYFIEKTRPTVKYWGIDCNIKRSECNFIRSHCIFGLCADIDFKSGMAKAGKGITFDLPPHVLFDQKATLALPFWSLTRDHFSDEIRDLFAFTTPLLPGGIELPDGSGMTIEDFSRLPYSKRSYYLKYAGSDASRNWGSKAVFRLSNLKGTECLSLLKQCLSGYESGEIWILQAEVIHNDRITYLLRNGISETKILRAKFSGFYGPFDFIGGMVMHRNFFKVHGQADTVISFMMPESLHC